MAHRITSSPLPRGVYLAPFTIRGDRFLYALDDAGELVGHRTVPVGADMTAPIDELWAKLDAIASPPVPLSSPLRLIS